MFAAHKADLPHPSFNLETVTELLFCPILFGVSNISFFFDKILLNLATEDERLNRLFIIVQHNCHSTIDKPLSFIQAKARKGKNSKEYQMKRNVRENIELTLYGILE